VTFLLDAPGAAPNEFLGRGSYYARGTVQVFVRGAPKTYLTTRGKALAIWNALNATTSLTGTTSNQFVKCVPMASGPMYLGQTDTGHEEFSIPFRIERKVVR
jgi:hypothetical protein